VDEKCTEKADAFGDREGESLWVAGQPEGSGGDLVMLAVLCKPGQEAAQRLSG
jgi:hypothetical protein